MGNAKSTDVKLDLIDEALARAEAAKSEADVAARVLTYLKDEVIEEGAPPVPAINE